MNRRELLGAAVGLAAAGAARRGTAQAAASPVPEGAAVRKLADGFTFTEGPAAGPDGRIYFSDIPARRIHAFDPKSGAVQVWREDSGGANGLMWSADGWLYACEGVARRVSRQRGEKIEAVAERFGGKRLNSPNDLVLDEHGGFYFTDPRYGGRDDLELDVEAVYYVDRAGRVERLLADLKKPNGIILSPDGKTLYVADPGDRTIWAYSVRGPGRVDEKRKLAAAGSDGMTVDERGAVYITYQGAVVVFSPAGEEIARIAVPEGPSNCTFGGPEGRTLYITARRGFYAIDLKVRGGRLLRARG